MNEQEFDDRIRAIHKALDDLYNHPLVQVHRLENTAGLITYANNLKKSITEIAANIIQIEIGIKKYSPQIWDKIK